MSYDDDGDFLAGGGGAPAISWKDRSPGFKVKGTILEISRTQQIDPQTKEPKTWKDGNPMWQHVFTIQTEARNPQIEDDDGKRRLFVKGSRKPESKSLAAAINGAAQRAGLQKQNDMVHAEIEVEYLGKGTPTSVGLAAPNLFAATLTPGVAPAALTSSDLF